MEFALPVYCAGNLCLRRDWVVIQSHTIGKMFPTSFIPPTLYAEIRNALNMLKMECSLFITWLLYQNRITPDKIQFNLRQ